MRKITTILMLLAITVGVAQTTPIDFESGGNGANFTWAVFENNDNPPLEFVTNDIADPTMLNSSSTIAKFTARSAASGAQPFAGTITSDGATFTLDETNSTVKIMVWKSKISDVGIKFEDGAGASTGEIKVANTLINQWEELTFDFSSRIGAPSSTDITGLVIFPDFSDMRDENVIYFDNITFGPQEMNDAPDTYTVDPSATQVGFANVFFTDGNFAFNSGWGVADVRTTLDVPNNQIILQPNFNTYADNPNDDFWRNNGGAGPLGNKLFEGNTFVEIPNYPNQSVTFTGNTLSKSITTPYNAADPFSYNTLAFIKVLDPNNGFAQVDFVTSELIEGQDFTITSTLAEGFLVQYGFLVYGLNANPADEATIGNVTVTSVSLSTNDVAGNIFSVFPNPATQQWNITSNETIKSIELFNVIGKRVVSVKANGLTTGIDASSLNAGIYIAKVTTVAGSSSVKLIKR